MTELTYFDVVPSLDLSVPLNILSVKCYKVLATRN